MFWKRPKPRPLHKKIWDEWKQLFASLTLIASMATGAYSYIAIDVDPFIETTAIVAVADTSRVYVEVKTLTDIPEHSYIIVTLDGQQVAHRVFPTGIPVAKHLMDIEIPFTSAGRHIDVLVEVIVMGPRTLFMPERLVYNTTIERHGGSNENPASNSSITVSPRSGHWI